MLSRIAVALLSATLMFTLSGCASDHSPAPVILLDSQETLQDFHYSADTYTVKKGDTLFAIAWYAGKDYQDIARINHLATPYNIQPGQRLRLEPLSGERQVKSEPVNPPSRSDSGRISKTIDKSRIESSDQQAYRKNIVNDQEVKRVNKPSKSVKKSSKNGFPDRINNWVWPSKGRLAKKFNRNESGRKGIEIRAERGSNIVAAAAGKVVYAGNGLRGYGNLIIIKHTDSFLSAYAHNDNILVTEQQWVSAGEHIASMGNSGTDYVKLHFEVRYRGKSLDPLRYLPKL